MVSALVSGLSSLGSGCGHCVVFLARQSHSASLTGLIGYKACTYTDLTLPLFMVESCLISVNSSMNRHTTYVDPRLALHFTRNKEQKKRLDGYSTAMHVLNGEDLTGKVAMVTGANSGIGQSLLS